MVLDEKHTTRQKINKPLSGCSLFMRLKYSSIQTTVQRMPPSFSMYYKSTEDVLKSTNEFVGVSYGGSRPFAVQAPVV